MSWDQIQLLKHSCTNLINQSCLFLFLTSLCWWEWKWKVSSIVNEVETISVQHLFTWFNDLQAGILGEKCWIWLVSDDYKQSSLITPSSPSSSESSVLVAHQTWWYFNLNMSSDNHLMMDLSMSLFLCWLIFIIIIVEPITLEMTALQATLS